uniref:Uncharacterized protein n=1 Tax=Trichogramma kaykai TaxID=54128 RepID=A0ABD2WRE7_9HYME
MLFLKLFCRKIVLKKSYCFRKFSRLLRGHTLLASSPELDIFFRTRCLVPSCECGSRFCCRWQVPNLLCRLHLPCESSPQAPTYGYPIASSSHSDRGFFTASEADDIARVFFLSGTRSTSGTGSTTPGEKTNLENSSGGDRTHALRRTLYQQARTIPTEPRRPMCVCVCVCKVEVEVEVYIRLNVSVDVKMKHIA